VVNSSIIILLARLVFDVSRDCEDLKLVANRHCNHSLNRSQPNCGIQTSLSRLSYISSTPHEAMYSLVEVQEKLDFSAKWFENLQLQFQGDC
jgi:hypothetical protein